MTSSLLIPVMEQAQAGEARRMVSHWARTINCGEEMEGRLALVVTELANNLALHTDRGGSLVVRKLDDGQSVGVSVLSLDRGPGVENFGTCMRDGYSTLGTSGIGLGGVNRTASTFDVHSQRGVGTALLAELRKQAPVKSEPGARLQAGALSVPVKGESVCGDAWAESYGPGWARYMVADGLGHGPLAAEAALKAQQIFLDGTRLSGTALLQRMHESLKSTRGAAVAIAHVDLAQGVVTYSGVGNTSGTIHSSGKSSNLVSHNGTIGAAMPTQPQEFQYPWPSDGILVMHSDGLKSQWQISNYAGLSNRHPEVIAGVLYRDFARSNDDATVLVATSKR